MTEATSRCTVPPAGWSVWGWASDRQPESFTGAHATRDLAMAEALTDREPGNEIWLQEGVYPEASRYFSVKLFLENAEECASDDLAHDDRVLEYSVEAECELRALVKAWANKHVTVAAWEAVGKPVLARPAAGTCGAAL